MDYKQRLRTIAFYLPQYHPIPENDEWWGKGFTEWTNVARARPAFPGHYQPHLPADLGFYDLRLPEVRQAQADLAREYGVDGFCYYHYWFNGRRLLERPFNEVLTSGQPGFPFCLCWANENWSRRWDGCEQQLLMGQQYSEEDDRRHIRWLVNAFQDPRYIRFEGKPLFLVYRAHHIPDPVKTTAIWREEAARAGLGEIFLCSVESFPEDRGDPACLGFDAAVEFQPDLCTIDWSLRRGMHGAYDYSLVAERMLQKPTVPYQRFPCVMPSWDNTARRKSGASVYHGSTPELYERWLRATVQRAMYSTDGEVLVFINAWNEWAEGNHLEPCQRWGHGYLEATRAALTALDKPISGPDADLRHSCDESDQNTRDAMVRAVLEDAAQVLQELQESLASGHAALSQAFPELDRLERFHLALGDIRRVIPRESAFILVDQQAWSAGPVLEGRRCIPFLEHGGQYWGLPPDDNTAIRELQRLRETGADFIVFAWSSFWWLDYYTGFDVHLSANFTCILKNDQVTIFDLRVPRDAGKPCWNGQSNDGRALTELEQLPFCRVAEE
jgi:glycosyl transferase family WbsX